MIKVKKEQMIRLQPKEYKRVEKAFIETMEDLGITKFPVDCAHAARLLNVRLVRYSELPRAHAGWLEEKYEDGFSAIAGSEYRIYYNDSIMDERVRFTLWYEMGHICLGHLDGTSETTDERKQQAECNHFARFALAPMPFVIMANPKGIDDVMRVFGVSFECASYVFDDYLNIIFEHHATAKKLLHSRITRTLGFDVGGVNGGGDGL